ncbi:MAG TPA: translation initiation factor IF-2 [Solirubrobacteraceae bacterium]|nr:translation initiation factor IF-2 [Solirubrobacteraceae bacterium]
MNKRVHEIAKERGLQPKEVLARLRAAGIDVKASSSSVDVDIASRILGNGNQNRPSAPPKAEPPTAAEAAKAAAGTVRAPAADPRRGSADPRRGTPPANGGQARAGNRRQQGTGSRGQTAGDRTPPPAVSERSQAPAAGGRNQARQPQPHAAGGRNQGQAPAGGGRSQAPAGGGRDQARQAQPQAGGGRSQSRQPQPQAAGGRNQSAPAARERTQAPAGDAAQSSASTERGEAPAAGGGQGGQGSGDGQHKRPTRDSLQGERAPGNAGGRRRVVIDSQASRRAGGPGGPGGPPQSNQPPRRQRRGRRRRGVYDEVAESRPTQTALADPSATQIISGSTVKDVAEYLDVSTSEIIKKLMGLGEMRTLTQTLSDETIEVLAAELNKEVEIVHSEDETTAEPVFDDAEEDLVERAPVVTIMGHVDHGKTSLLDAIRETRVAAGEAGGITQHIGAYQVVHDDHKITFLDTPGHEAFTAMRARGAKVTDIAVIVVAADDGVKPQTQEAVDHAKDAGVPMLVAVNKIDKEGAQPERVRAEMAQLGLQPVQWGGETEFVDVSAKTREGLDDLLETIIVMAEVEELRANPDAAASGTVIESKLDPGRGPVVTILVSRGTLEVGDALVAGAQWGRVRAMHDYLGKRIGHALPGEPVEVLGFNGVPEAGEHVRVVEHERRARQLAMERETRLKAESLARQSGKRVSLENIFGSGLQELNLVLKADVAGSLEAIEDEIAKLPQDEVSVNVIRRAVGAVTESDVMLAAASDAVILAFNVRPVGDARAAAEREGVEIRSYSVIYRAIEELRSAMQGMLAPEEVEEALGSAEVRQIFRASRVGTIAGSHVTEGRITRGSKVRLVRDGTVIWDGEIASLRRFNEDAREVAAGFDCGIVLRDYADVKEGDVLETYTTRQVERELT